MIPKRWIIELHGRFYALWGAKWADHVSSSGGPEVLVDTWVKGLEDLTGEQIGKALEYCGKHHAWPPSIAEFREARHQGLSREQRAFQARLPTDPIRRLPKETWEDQRARGKAHLDALKAKLRGHHAES